LDVQDNLTKQLTSDGSHTIHSDRFNATYHSIHGAIQESRHVFINAGLDFYEKPIDKTINVFEMGFGTGLNALLTWIWAKRNSRKVNYTGLEAYPISTDHVDALNYPVELAFPDDQFKRLHNCFGHSYSSLDHNFNCRILKQDLFNYDPDLKYDVVFYDAFGPGSQPELWEERAIRIIVDLMAPNAILTTYSAKGSVRRAMQSLGLEMERIPGPPGKREMLRGVKL
jgi:tRNA U34 5-methylaminomethyl-2-thiouridine-forming methyltransferase MnmC